MGFSVSGSAAIIFLAAFIGIGIFYTAAYNSYELIDEAEDEKAEQFLEQQNTDALLQSVNTNTTINYVNITIKNTGSTTLHLDKTDLLIDGSYQSPDQTSVDQDADAELWHSGQILRMNVSYTISQGETIRVKLITEHGVAVFQEVTA